MNRTAKQTGFTLIELVLAMSFISILLLAIAMTIIQIGNIYTRGITLKEVNQTGRALTQELTQRISGSQPFSLDEAEHHILKRPTGGQLCMGQYTYIWNYGLAITNKSSELAKYADGKEVHLARVEDPGSKYCVDPEAYKVIPVDDEPTELVNVGDRSLTVYQFAIDSTANAFDSTTGQRLYTVSFTIGTSDVSALNDALTGCRDRGDAERKDDLNYCSIQQFVLVVRAGNRVN